ncbi:MAG: triphosphoribosyl-dephospho-CoA synthase [Methylotenera sp.]|nr:triphosphoribosyl-dephospho-CoA synthase [Methylotenera sp.]
MSTQPLNSAAVAQAYRRACMTELQAIKPGNVHVFADGHGMTVYDFIKSADATAAVITQADLSVGERILLAVQATQSAVAMNTNLGLILLCAPLIQAALASSLSADLPARLAAVLNTLSIEDGRLAATAILIAKPAGLGNAPEHDVQAIIEVSLKHMMAAAAEKDLIAWQYAHDYQGILKFGLPRFVSAKQAWQAQAKNDSEAWATTAVYLAYLAHYPDSHIVRKHGLALAKKISLEAQAIEADYAKASNPKLMQKQLLAWDASLKQRNINPGTSADLTVATLLAFYLQQ